MGRRHFGSVRKLPSGRYQAGYWHEGWRHVAPETFKTKADAQAWLATHEADIVRGSWAAPARGKVTFGEYAQAWFDKQVHLRPRTCELYAYLLRAHIEPTFGDKALSAIVNSEVVAWHRGLTAKVPGTAPKCYRLPRQIIATAVADGYLVKSPAAVKGASRERCPRASHPHRGRGPHPRRSRRSSLPGHDLARRRVWPPLRRAGCAPARSHRPAPQGGPGGRDRYGDGGG